MSSKALYEVLGLRPGAGRAEVLRAARRLERTYHPSLNPGDREAARKFEEVREAFEILSDPARRRAYDKEHPRPAAPKPAAPRPAAEAPDDVYVTVSLGLEEAARGVERDVVYAGRRRCGHCRGTGCPRCHAGSIASEESVRVTIPGGVDAGSEVRVTRIDHASGSVVVVTRIEPHPLFRRMGSNLHIEVPVTVPEAALGARIDVPTLDGRASLKIPPATQSGQKLRLRERGMPSLHAPGRGDLYVEVKVLTPEANDEQARDLLRQLARWLEKSAPSPRGHLAPRT